METTSCVQFSPIFYRLSSLLFSCLVMTMVVVDGLSIQGSIDLHRDRSPFITSTRGTAVISDFASLRVPNVTSFIRQQTQIFDIAENLDIQFFSCCDWLSPSLSQVMCLIAMATMICMMWQQKEQVFTLQKELRDMVADNNTKQLLIQQMQSTLDNQQSQFTGTTYKMAAMNKRIDKISSELDEENTDLETMYKCLKEWKEEWIDQSAKIRQINPVYLAKLPEIYQSDVDKMIEEQKQQIGKYISHAETQFERIHINLKQDNGAITNIFDDLDYIHDVLSAKKERSQ